MSLYRFVVLGEYTQKMLERLQGSVIKDLMPLQLRYSEDVEVVDGCATLDWTEQTACAAVFFGGEKARLYDVSTLLAKNIPVVTVTSTLKRVSEEMPPRLARNNCLSLATHSYDEIVHALFECAGLLPRQRKVFISYAREDSRDVALQLYEALLERQYMPFLDSHSIRHSTIFQEELRHEIIDSALFIMLHTENYEARKWAVKEYNIACGKQIPIFRVLWPGSGDVMDLACNFKLRDDDLLPTKKLTDKKLKQLLADIETARSTGYFKRMQSMLSNIRYQMKTVNAVMDGLGPGHTFYIKAYDERRLFFYPILTMPTAEDFYRTHTLSETAAPALVVDSIGAKKEWLDQLAWIKKNITCVECLELPEVWLALVDRE